MRLSGLIASIPQAAVRHFIRSALFGALPFILVPVCAARSAGPVAEPLDEGINWAVSAPVDQAYAENQDSAQRPASATAGFPGKQPVSVHRAELEYHRQQGAETEAEWDALRTARPAAQSALPAGASAPGPFRLQKEVFGWHPYWEGSGYTNYTFELLSTVAYFSYEVNPTNG